MKPRLALVIADTDQHALAAQALMHSLRGVDPAQVIVFSDRKEPWPAGCDWIPIEPMQSIEAYNRLMTRDLAQHVRADHALIVQYDGFVLHAEQFEAAFLQQDYLGAPWPQFQHHVVGNGGFSLRSRRLIEAVAALPNHDHSEAEDVFICRTSRLQLEGLGLHFGPPEMACRFSMEWPPVSYRTWGFHGVFHLPRVYRNHLDFLIDNLPERSLSKRARQLMPFVEALSTPAAKRLRQRLGAFETSSPASTLP